MCFVCVCLDDRGIQKVIMCVCVSVLVFCVFLLG